MLENTFHAGVSDPMDGPSSDATLSGRSFSSLSKELACCETKPHPVGGQGKNRAALGGYSVRRGTNQSRRTISFSKSIGCLAGCQNFEIILPSFLP